MSNAKLLILIPSMGRGGAEMHTLRLINGLADQGYSLTLACMRGGGDYEGSIDPRVTVKILCPRWVRSATLGCLLAVPALARLLATGGFGIVCAMLPQSLVALHRAIRLSGVRPAVIAGIQNNLTADLENADASASLTWNCGAFRQAMGEAAAVVALSQGVHDDIVRIFPLVANRVFMIPNIGCSEEVIAAGESETKSRSRPMGLLVVACGRLEPQKDYPTLLEAIAVARRDLDVRLWILGRGSLDEQLRKRCEELKIANVVEFLGFQQNPYPLIAAADLFVLSSRWEGFGNVIVEAMACGVPVISTDCPFGPAEILDGGKFGSLVPVGDAMALAEEISRLGSSAEHRAQLRAAGMTRARDYLPGPIVSQYAEVFDHVATGLAR